jgi:preprotein translocase SecE subunit
MAVAVKNSPETSTSSVFDRLPIVSLVGVVYVVSSLVIVFGLLPTLWQQMWGSLSRSANPFASGTLLGIVMLCAFGGLLVLGGRMLGPKTQPGVRAGIAVGLFSLLLIVGLIRWYSVWSEYLIVHREALVWFAPPNSSTSLGFLPSVLLLVLFFPSVFFGYTGGLAMTIAVGVFLLFLFLRWFFKPSAAGALMNLEEQGWFSATTYKKGQGMRVRRGTIIGILLLFGSGVISLVNHQTLRGMSSLDLNIPFTGKIAVTKTSAGDAKDQLEKLYPQAADAWHGEWFKITDETLAQLRPEAGTKDPDADEVVARLKLQKEVEFTQAQFQDMLKTALTEKERKDFQERIESAAAYEKPILIDRYVLRDVNRDYDPEIYYKIKQKIEGSEFKDGQIVLKTAYEELEEKQKKDQTISVPMKRPPEPAEGSLSFASIRLLPAVQFTVPLLLGAVIIWFAWRVVNLPGFADFLIATEAELNKVSWTTRKRLYQDTIVVLVTVVLLATYLFVMDQVWGYTLSSRYIGVIVLKPDQSKTRPGEQKPW